MTNPLYTYLLSWALIHGSEEALLAGACTVLIKALLTWALAFFKETIGVSKDSKQAP